MNQNEPKKKEYELPLRKKDVAEIFGVSIMTIDREMWDGRLGYVKIGKGSIRFYDHHIQAYLKSCEAKNSSSENQMAANAS